MIRCEFCGKEYQRIGFHLLTSHNINYYKEIICLNCGNKFKVKYGDRKRKFCNHSCELSHRNKQNWSNLEYIIKMKQQSYKSGFNKASLGLKRPPCC